MRKTSAICFLAGVGAGWVDAGVAIFGGMKSATIASGKSGITFTNEGSHWNDTGSKISAKVLAPVFNFLH